MFTEKFNKPFLIFIAIIVFTGSFIGCSPSIGTNESTSPKTTILTIVIPLTEEEVQQYNNELKPILVDSQGTSNVNILSNFFTSYYDKPEDINLEEFLAYFPPDNDVHDEDEFKALKEDRKWPFDGVDMTISHMPVPIHRFSAATVNGVLQKYMGISLDDLNGVDTENLIYLDEYDSYYNFTSDFAAGVFYCTHGEAEGDIVRLFNESVKLTLKKHDDDFLIVSHQLINKTD